MRPRGKALRLRTLLLVVATVAVVFTAIRESLIWYETRKFVVFHEYRARHLAEKAERFQSSRPEAWRAYRRFASWHVGRARAYRRAHKTYFSDEMKADLWQTLREQDFERTLKSAPGGTPGRPIRISPS